MGRAAPQRGVREEEEEAMLQSQGMAAFHDINKTKRQGVKRWTLSPLFSSHSFGIFVMMTINRMGGE